MCRHAVQKSGGQCEARREVLKSNYGKGLAVLVVGGGLLSVERVVAAHSGDGDRDGQTLQRTCVVAVPGRGVPPFKSSLTLDAGGTMTETTDNLMFSPAFRGLGHGVWKQRGAARLERRRCNGERDARQDAEDQPARPSRLELTRTSSPLRTSIQFFDPTGALLVSGLRVSHRPAFRVIGARACVLRAAIRDRKSRTRGWRASGLPPSRLDSRCFRGKNSHLPSFR